MPRRFEFFEHTADLGVRARGGSLGEAFSAAALGVFSHVADPSRVEEVGEFVLELSASTPEELLVRFLEEALFVSGTRLVLFRRFEADVSGGPPWRVRARAFGESYDPARHGHIHEVKAVTYHGVRVERDPPLVEVVVDI